MLKTFVAAAAALAIAGSTLVLAQPPAPPAAPGAAAEQPHHRAMRDGGRYRPTAEDLAAYTDARIAGLKAGLRLTPEQEKNWPAVETAIREDAKQRADRMQERRGRADERRDASGDLIERLRHRADAMTRRAADLKRFAEASEPLYRSLDDSQKRRLTALMRHGMRDHHGRDRH